MRSEGRRHRRTRLIAVGLCSLVTAGALGAGVPLFDGVGFPDEPYRYVMPPEGATATAAPTVATVAAAIANGSNAAGFEVASGEQGPQISIYVPAGSVVPDGMQTSVTVTATPVAPGGTEPANGPVTGDVYRVAAAMATLEDNTAGTLTLRAPVGFKVIPVMDYRSGPGAAWHTLQTSRVGNDIFEAPFDDLGDYAMVLPAHGSSATHSTSKGVIIALAIFVGLALIVVLVARGFRTIGSAPDLDGYAGPDPDNGTDDLDDSAAD